MSGIFYHHQVGRFYVLAQIVNNPFRLFHVVAAMAFKVRNNIGTVARKLNHQTAPQ
jgi:hypothetical protein